MNWRAAQASERRLQREEQRRRRDLERRTKEEAKLSEIERSRLEVETYESWLEVLVSAHKEQSERLDWVALKASLLPPCPVKSSYHEYRAKQRIAVLPDSQKDDSGAMLAKAQNQDEEAHHEALQSYAKEKAEWERLKDLASRVIAGEHKAYHEALTEFNPFAEFSGLGSQLRFTVPNPKLLVCVLKVKGTEVIPSEVKTLTATGKVSVKQMPRARFHELYQDCLCSYMLRVAREVFALLPVETLLITACADSIDPRTGQTVEQPVLSAAMPRAEVDGLNFERLDPSDAIENLTHRGDFRASRKSGTFMPITPLTPADIAQPSIQSLDLPGLSAEVKRLREELTSMVAELQPSPREPAPEEGVAP
ncbi:MAG: hypothetical protein NTW87_11730 [Planctomycetota bacterium]|nr:hypothetical protein [Planctomycetota bacterium]